LNRKKNTAREEQEEDSSSRNGNLLFESKEYKSRWNVPAAFFWAM
jgi:hypothetical protein